MNRIDTRTLRHHKEQNVPERHNHLDKLEEELQQWCFEIEDKENNRGEFLARLEIAEKIIECYILQQPYLDLSRTRSSHFPSFHAMRHITTLDLSNNSHIEIDPSQFDGLSNLKTLDISNCRIKSSRKFRTTLRKIDSVIREGSIIFWNK